MVLPAETLVGFTLLFNNKKKREWILASLVGAFLGYAAIALIMHTSLEPMLINFIRDHDPSGTFTAIMSKTSKYGYLNITLGTLTFIPANIALIGGMLIGLNPSIVFIIVCVCKIIRVAIVIEGIQILWKSAKFIKNKVKHRKDASSFDEMTEEDFE